MKLFKGNNAVDQRSPSQRIETSDNVLPDGLRVGRAVIADGHASDANPTEQQRCRIKVGYGAAASSDDADSASIAEEWYQPREQCATDAVNDELEFFRPRGC